MDVSVGMPSTGTLVAGGAVVGTGAVGVGVGHYLTRSHALAEANHAIARAETSLAAQNLANAPGAVNAVVPPQIGRLTTLRSSAALAKTMGVAIPAGFALAAGGATYVAGSKVLERLNPGWEQTIAAGVVGTVGLVGAGRVVLCHPKSASGIADFFAINVSNAKPLVGGSSYPLRALAGAGLIAAPVVGAYLAWKHAA